MAQNAQAQVLSIEPKFAASVTQSSTYPLNLVQQQTYSAQLRAYQQRLIEESPRVFEDPVGQIQVPIRDFNNATKRFERKDIRNLDELRFHHGMHVTTTGNNNEINFTKPDPKCRAIFIFAKDSRSKLKVSKEMMLEILSFNQVMPGYLDLIFLFGENTGPNDLKFSAFREQSSLRTNGVGLDDLKRSGQKFELCYNLKTVNRKKIAASVRAGTAERSEWSVRQAGIFHKLDVKLGTTFWMFTKGSLELEDRFVEVTNQDDRPEDRTFDTPEAAFRASLAIHAMLIQWASETWRWYIQWLDEEIEKETGRLRTESREPSKARTWYQARDLQRIQKHSDDVSEVILALEGNMEVMCTLQEHYKLLLKDQDFTISVACEEYVSMFIKQTRNANYDLKLQCSRAKALSKISLERKALMVQYMNAQIAEKQEDLTNSTYRVSISAEEEAIVMRIITVATLLFLPATFVSTVFSTPLVSFQQNDLSSSNSNGGNTNDYGNKTALYTWLMISLPLTAGTCIIASFAYYWTKKRRQYRREKETSERFWV